MQSKLKLFVFAFFIFLLFVLPQMEEVQAETIAKHGVITEVKGEVTYQKGVSFHRIPVSVSQKWYPGDVIRTGKNSFVEINMPETGDTFSIDENAEVYFTYENENVFVYVLKGGIYVAAQERVSEKEALFIITREEIFEVLGTHFLVQTDLNGDTWVNVFSGVVNNRDNTRGQENDDDWGQAGTLIYPGQERGSTQTNSRLLPHFMVDMDDFTHRVSVNLLERLLENGNDIDDENRRMWDLIVEGLRNQGLLFNDSNDDFSESEIERLMKYLDNLIVNSIRTAMDNNRMPREEIERIVDELNNSNPERKIDLDNIPPLENLNSDRLKEQQEKQRQVRQQREEQAERERQQREEMLNRNQELADKIKQEREKQVQQNQEEREKMEEAARNRLQEQRQPAPPPPRPTPPRDPVIKDLIAQVDSGTFMIDVSWGANDEYQKYNIYLNGEVVATIDDSTFQFTDLIPDTEYSIKIEALDANDKVVARSEFKQTTENVFTEINLNMCHQEAYVIVEIVDAEESQACDDEEGVEDGEDSGEISSYEVWINGEKLSSLEISDENNFRLESVLFTETTNEIEVFGINEVDKKIGYGRLEFISDFDNPDVSLPKAELEVNEIHSDSADILWKTLEPYINLPDYFNPEFFTLEIYETDSNEVKDTITHDPDDGGYSFTIEGLEPSTNYLIVEKVRGIIINQVEFTTEPESPEDDEGGA